MREEPGCRPDPTAAADERYRRLVDRLPVGVFQSGSTGRILTCNDAFVALLGYASRDQVLALNERRFYVDAEDRDRLLARLRTESVVEGHEQRWCRADGRVIWVMVSVRRIEGPGESVLDGIAVDVTDRKRAAEVNAWLAAIVDSSDDAIIGLTLDGIVTSWNGAAERLYGYRSADIVGRPLALLAPSDRPDEIPGMLARIRRGERLDHYETVRVARDGRRVDVSLTLSPVMDATGAIVGASTTARDLAPHRWAEALARDAADLRRSNTDLRQFAYVASHDLQEPLRTVAGYVQLLARRYEGRLDRDADEFIGYAVDGVHRMQALIRDLLAYARVETRGRPLTTTDADAALDAALENLTVAREENGAAVSREPLPRVRADLSQLTLVFQNLIGNAIKFRGADRPQIHVSAAWQDGAWCFAVTDNGIGVPAEHRDRVFVIFQRLHTREEYPGTGIGLALCRRIVERHGGRIWLEAGPAGGTVARFTLFGDGGGA